MTRRIMTPDEKARVIATRADTLFARVTARYKVEGAAKVDPEASATLLKVFGLYPGTECVYYRCTDERLTILEAVLTSTAGVKAIDLLQDDATMFASANTGNTALFLHVTDKNDNKRWIPAVLLKPV